MQAALEAQGALARGWKVVVVLTVGRSRSASFNIEGLLDLLQAANPDAAIIGGIATGGWVMRAHEGQARVIRDGAVGLLLRGNVPLTALVCNRSPLQL